MATNRPHVVRGDRRDFFEEIGVRLGRGRDRPRGPVPVHGQIEERARNVIPDRPDILGREGRNAVEVVMRAEIGRRNNGERRNRLGTGREYGLNRANASEDELREHFSHGNNFK